MNTEPVESQRSDREKYWKRHITQWQASGMTQADYCREHGLKYFQLHYYKKKMAADDGNSQRGRRLRLVPINPPRLSRNHTAYQQGLRVSFDGFTIDVGDDFNKDVLCRLIQTLRSSSC